MASNINWFKNIDNLLITTYLHTFAPILTTKRTNKVQAYITSIFIETFPTLKQTLKNVKQTRNFSKNILYRVFLFSNVPVFFIIICYKLLTDKQANKQPLNVYILTKGTLMLFPNCHFFQILQVGPVGYK